MTPRDDDDARNDHASNDDARSDDPRVDRPEDLEGDDEAAEPTVTRLSRADVRRYAESQHGDSAEHPQPAQPGPDPDGVDDDWHEVRDPSGSEHGQPHGQATPPREPAPGDDPDRTVSSDDPDRTVPLHHPGHPDTAADDQPTRTVDRPTSGEDAPTVVTGSPLIGDRRGVAQGFPERPTKVMGAPAEPSPAPTTPLVARPAGLGAAGATAAAATAGPGEYDEDSRRADLRSEREARDHALGKRRPQPLAAAPSEPPSTRLPRTTDRFAASLGLFLLRLAVAAVLGVRGAQQLMDIPATVAEFAATALPYPEILAWATAIASVLVAVALVLGLAVRVAGLGAALVGVGALVYVFWWRMPFEAGVMGFSGETELLLTVLGVFLLLVGGGAWGIDGAIRKGRLQRKAEKFEAEQI